MTTLDLDDNLAGITDEKSFQNSTWLRKYVETLQQFEIRRPYYFQNGKFTLRDLQGPEKKKIFSKINLKDLKPGDAKLELMDTVQISLLILNAMHLHV